MISLLCMLNYSKFCPISETQQFIKQLKQQFLIHFIQFCKSANISDTAGLVCFCSAKAVCFCSAKAVV